MSEKQLRNSIAQRVFDKIPEVTSTIGTFDNRKSPQGTIFVSFAVAQASHYHDLHAIYTDRLINHMKLALDEGKKYSVYVQDKNPTFNIYLIPKEGIDAL